MTHNLLQRALEACARRTPAGWVLAGLVGAGVAVRVVACVALWPLATTLSDSANYAVDAATNPLADPQHPAGYPALLALIGLVTRNVAAVIVLQHGLGIASALLLFAAVRRLAGSPWPALIPAAVVLLDTDQIFLEHNVMSDGPFVFVVTVATYAAVRAFDAPARSSWRWSLFAGVAVAVATVVRTSVLFAIPVLALAIFAGRGATLGARRRTCGAFLCAAALPLAGYAFVNLQESGRFELAPATGWHLYARVAPFADCRRFTPPAGTEALCERSPLSWRSGPDFYLYSPRSPARRLFGRIGSHDGTVGAFALGVIANQPVGYLSAFGADVLRYFVPSARPHGWYKGWDIQPQLDWGRTAGTAYTRDTIAGLRRFFNHVAPRRNDTAIGVMRDYERVLGFGATLLTICTVLSLLGVLAGPRRNRAGVLLFSGTGLAQLIAPTLGVLYMGRYVVPSAGLVAAGAAIAARGLVQAWERRRGLAVAPAAMAGGARAAPRALATVPAFGENCRGGHGDEFVG